MLLELYDLGLEARTLHVLAGLVLGLVFGIAAQASRFCLRRAIAGPVEERASAGAVWLTGLVAAIIGFSVVASFGLIDLGDHRFLSSSVPVAAVVLGGLAFGAGMVLTRGCVSRLTVLSATGNLRAVLVILVFALTAHATIKGVLAPIRSSLGALTVDLPFGTLFAAPLGLALVLVPLVALTGMLIWRARPRTSDLALGVLIGLVAVGGWAATSTLLFDDFDPLPVQSAAFTLPWSDTLFWTIASSAIPAGFGVGFIGGVLTGSLLSATLRRELTLQSFTSPGQTVRYVAGGVLLGAGGVLAGGCTVGAGLSGVATGSVTALLALVSIVIGAWAAAQTERQTGLAPAPV